MAHQVVYVAGNTSFNESYATFVEQEGTLQYLRASNLGYKMEKIQQNYEDRLLFQRWIDETVKELNDLYSTSLDEDMKRLRKQLIFEKLKQRYQQNQTQFQFLNYNRWFAQDLNNSHLLGVKRYNNFVPAFSGTNLFFVDPEGNVTNLDVESGEVLWESELEMTISTGIVAGFGLLLLNPNCP